MFSLMNTGENFYCHLMAEQVLSEVMEQPNDRQKRGLLEETVSSTIVRDILDEALSYVRVFLDTSGIVYFDSTVLNNLLDVTESLLDSQNEVLFVGEREEIKEALKSGIQKRKYETWEEFSQKSGWFLAIGNSRYLKQMGAEHCYEIIRRIHYDNLRILVAEGPKGKTLDMKRLLEDGEDCVYYYCYKLALKMVKEKLVFSDSIQNKKICLVAGNDAGYYVVRELSKILGTNKCTEKDIVVKPVEMDKYIIVRDVIHMFCELSRLTAMIEGSGGLVGGSACLIDINTGVGSRKNRVSLYTIDLEKGISYRLRQKRIEEKNEF